MSKILIQNGRVIDPSQSMDHVTSLLLVDGKVAAYDAHATGTEQVLDATGLIVAPGLIDLHVQLREPGWEDDETIETGTAAALQGGFTAIACVPATDPPLDTQAGVEFVRQKAARANHCRVHVLACVSKNGEGKELAEIGSLVEAGAIGFTDAPRSIQNSELLRRALEYCLMFDKPILNHPEVEDLSHDGVMHEGLVSLLLGLTGIPAEAEDVMAGRDLRLAEATGGRLHLMNLSSSGSVDLVRRAKSRNVPVTAGIAVDHFCFTDESLRCFDSNFKVNPPLRSLDHVEACIAGLMDHTIDVICTGHAPRALEKKMLELDQAPFGTIGLETALAAVITYLVAPGKLSWPSAIAKMSWNPARVLGLPHGTLAIGAEADVTVIDPEARWTVTPARFASKSSNSPFRGQQLQGLARYVIVGGTLKLDRTVMPACHS